MRDDFWPEWMATSNMPMNKRMKYQQFRWKSQESEKITSVIQLKRRSMLSFSKRCAQNPSNLILIERLCLLFNYIQYTY